MPTYMLLSNVFTDEPMILMRLNDDGVGDMDRLAPEGWVPDNEIGWTGIGGDADWDSVDPEKAADAAVSLGRFRSDVLGS